MPDSASRGSEQALSVKVGVLQEASDQSKIDRRDIWLSINAQRESCSRLEHMCSRMIDGLASFTEDAKVRAREAEARDNRRDAEIDNVHEDLKRRLKDIETARSEDKGARSVWRHVGSAVAGLAGSGATLLFSWWLKLADFAPPNIPKH